MAYSSFVIATNRPVAYYRLEETSGTTANDASDNNFDGTYVGSPTFSQASAIFEPNTKSVLFNGSTQYIDMGTQIDTEISSIFSLSFYLKFTSLPALGETFSLIDCHDRFQVLALKTASFEGVYIFLPGLHTLNTDGPFIPLSSFNTSDFFNITITYDQVKLIIYLNGQPIDGELQGGTLQAAGGNGTFIGVDNTGASNFFGGLLDEVGFFKTAIEEHIVGLNYHALNGEKYYRAAILGTYPKCYLLLDEVGGVVASDKTDNSFDGVYEGAPDLNVSGKFETGAVLSSTTTDYIDIGLPLGAGSSGGKTISFFVKPDNFDNLQYLVTNKNIGVGGFSIVLNTDGTVGMSWTASENVVQTTTALETTEYSHIVVIFALDNTGTIYINGKKSASGALGVELTNNNKIRIGGQWSTFNLGSDSLFDGGIDEFSIWDKELDEFLIYFLYFYGSVEYPFFEKFVLSLGPSALWLFDETSGNIVDHTGNGHHLVQSGGTVTRRIDASGSYLESNYGIRYRASGSQHFYAQGGDLIPTQGGSSSDYTYEIWAKLVTVGTWNYYFYKTANNGITLSWWAGPPWLLTYRDDDGGYTRTSTAIIPNTWSHFMFVRERQATSTLLKIYVNGVNVYNWDVGDHILPATANTKFLLAVADIYVALMAVYPYAFSTEEVERQWQAGMVGFGFRANVNGYVYDDNENVLSSKVRISNAETGAFLKDEQNDPVTGAFLTSLSNFDEIYVQSIPDDSNYRSMVHGPLTPEVV